MPSPNSTRSRRWILGIAFVGAGAVVSYAIQTHNWKLAQVTSIIGVVFALAGLALLADISSTLFRTSKDKRDKWLTRLVAVAAVGTGAILLYSIQYDHWKLGLVASTASIGFLTAGAAWLTGALLGFLFGIPHTREEAAERTEHLSTKPKLPGEEPQETKEATRYEPSTSLEQISDWLTKIIVGVGLTKLSEIPGQLWKLASFVAVGMGGGEAAKVFALGTIIYFSVCGFLFGYLWSRLYMMEAFRAADVLRRVEEIGSQMLDLRAKALVENHLDPSKPEAHPEVLAEAIDMASDDAKFQIFERAKEARSGDNANDRTRKRAIPVVRALIAAAADPEKADHQYHAELGYLLLRLGELRESADEFTKAIQIREDQGRSGWKNYELERATANIRQDRSSEPSSPETVAQVLADLRRAYTDPKHQVRIIEERPFIGEWLSKNSLSFQDLGSSQRAREDQPPGPSR